VTDILLTLDKIYKAAHVLKDVIRKTDLIKTTNLIPDCDLYLKTENLQITGSFKVRGAYFKMANLTPEERAKGVVASSAGNHAQGVALAAQKSGTNATIFIPSVAPISKIEATRSYGVNVEIIDGVYDDAYKAALKRKEETDAVFIHPFDDFDVIAGQGTIGLEILEQLPDVEAVIVPIGGGGLISGIAYAIKNLKPDCKIYGVQAEGAASMFESVGKKTIISLFNVCTFADGISVKTPGKNTYRCCTQYVDDIVTVSDDEMAAAILVLMEQQKLVTEGAGACAFAAAMYKKLPIKGKKTVVLLSGGNIDVNMLSRIINRGLLTSGRLCDITLKMIDKPGQLRDVAQIVASYGANVVKVRHNLGVENMQINECLLHLSLETRDHNHFLEIKKGLEAAGYTLYVGHVCPAG